MIMKNVIQQVHIIKVHNRFVCMRNGRWETSGSLISASMFANKKAAERMVKFLAGQDKEGNPDAIQIASSAYTHPNLFN